MSADVIKVAGREFDPAAITRIVFANGRVTVACRGPQNTETAVTFGGADAPEEFRRAGRAYCRWLQTQQV